jgi:hypothetical protein
VETIPGEPIQVGPFRGGLNTFSDESAIADNELVVCDNFDPDVDGSLKSRPPVIEIGDAMPLDTTGNPKLVASIRSSGGDTLLIASDGSSNTYYFDGSDWNLITNTFAASAATEYNGLVWIVSPPSSAAPGGYWSVGGGFVTDANMPHGGDIVEFKSRLWVVRGKDATTEGTRLFFSAVLGVTPFWPVAPNFIEVGLGDGENIVAISVYFNVLLLWRTASIFRFTYTTDPANGDVAVIVPGIGLESRESLANYEAYFYFMYEGRAYEFINNRAAQINQLVSFGPGATSGIAEPFSVSIVAQRVIFQWYTTSYVFHLRTKTWTTWTTTAFGSFGRWLARPMVDGVEESVCFSSTSVPLGPSRETTLLSMFNTFTERTETILSAMQTKNYDYESSTLVKRLFFWAVSAAWNGTLKATQGALNFTQHPTWGQILLDHTWGSLRAASTWGGLSSDRRLHITERPSTGSGPLRKEAKVGHRAKFKRINYRVEVENDGSSTTAPVRLFYLTTYVRAGQVISKDVS